jgi:hypothetical protein
LTSRKIQVGGQRHKARCFGDLGSALNSGLFHEFDCLRQMPRRYGAHNGGRMAVTHLPRRQASQDALTSEGREPFCSLFLDLRSALSAQTIHASAISSKVALWAGISFASRRHSSAYRRNSIGSSPMGICSYHRGGRPTFDLTKPVFRRSCTSRLVDEV